MFKPLVNLSMTFIYWRKVSDARKGKSHAINLPPKSSYLIEVDFFKTSNHLMGIFQCNLSRGVMGRDKSNMGSC
jgi:hypothetical protein